MKRTFRNVVSILGIVFAAACAAVPAPPIQQPAPTGGPIGVVVTLAGAPAADVDLRLHTNEVGVTNTDGYFVWPSLSPGPRHLVASKGECHGEIDVAPQAGRNWPIALECPAPPAPVDPPLSAPWVGQLHKARDDLGFEDASGRAVLPLCAHFGEAFSAFVHDKRIGPVDVAAQLRIIRKAGYDCIRVWDVLGYYDQSRPDQPVQWKAWTGAEVTPYGFQAYSGRNIPATDRYYERLGDFIALADRVGLPLFHSRGDLNAIRLDRVLEHTQRVGGIYGALGKWSTLALAEANNENFQNGSFSPEELRRIVEPFKAHGALTIHSTADPAEEPAAIRDISAGASIYSVHGLRTGAATQLLEHIFSLGYFPRQPDWPGVPRLGIQGEPAGPGNGVSVGQVNDRELLALMAATSLMSRQWWVYMSGNGVFWRGPIEAQPGFYAVPRIRDAIAAFAPDVMSWALYHGGRAEAALKSPTGYEGDPGNVEGPARIFNAVRADRRAVVAVIEGGKGAKRLQNFLDCQLQLHVIGVNDDETLSRASFVLDPRASMAVDYRFGRVLLGACSPQ